MKWIQTMLRRSAAGALLAAGMMAGTARGQTEYFVATNGTDNGSNSGLSWAQPLLTISNGVAKAAAAGAGSIVTVSNGTYAVAVNVLLTNANMILRSYGGGVPGGLANASNTVVKAAGKFHRALAATKTNCLIDGFTLTGGGGDVGRADLGGDGGDGGSGLYMTADSLVRHCIITNNGGDNVYGSGVYMSAGTVSNCVISANKGGGGMESGGGVNMSGGKVLNCVITGNGGGCDNGGGVYISGGTIRNCLIRNNTATRQGGGVYMQNSIPGGLVESCTIVSNSADLWASNAGGGVYRDQGTVRNCVVYLNTATNNPATSNYYATGGFEYSASAPQPPPTEGANNILAADPMFIDAAAGNYMLKIGSPCIDAGTNQAWMVGATDLAGDPRKRWGGVAASKAEIVDMGAYEAPRPPPKGTTIILR